MIDIFLWSKFIKILQHQIFINLRWLILERFLRLIGGVLVTAWVARYLGPSDYGIFAYYIALVAIFSTISGLGLDGILVREFSRNPLKARALVSKAITLRIISGLICLLLLTVYLLITDISKNELSYGIIVGLSLIFQANDTIDLWFQSKSQNKTVVFIKIISFSISSILKIVLILIDAKLIYFISLFSIEAFINSVLLAYKYKIKNFKFIFKINHAKHILRESWPFILSGLAIMIYMRIDQIFIKKFLSDLDLGNYSIGIIFSQFWYIFPVILSTAIAPYISKLKTNDEKKYELLFSKMFIGAWLLSALIIILTYGFAELLILSMYGSEYINAVEVLKIHIFTNFFVFIGVIQNIWMINEKKGNLMLYKTLIGCLVSVISNIILIPRFGIIGAAYSAVLAQFFSVYLSNIVFSKKLFKLQMGLLSKA